MHKRFLPIVTVIIVLSVFLLISCSDEIQMPQKPGIRGRISLPASSELAPEEIWVKAVEGETTKYVGRVNPDGTFLIPNLDSEKKYNIHFTSIEPEFENKRSVGDRAAGRKPYGGWLTDVSASIDASVGSVKMKPLGTIMGTAIRTGAADNYDVMVYIPGTSLMAMTDAEGNFSITNVPQGTHRIRYTSSGYLSLMKEGVVLASDSDDESPTKVVAEASLIREAGIVRGTVTLKGAQSHEGIIIRLEGADPEDVATGTTTEDGAFLIPDVKPGTYSALISYPGHVPQRLEGITVRAAETTSIGQAVALSANGGDITGKITLNDGKPLSGAAVLATITIDGKRYSFSTTTDAEGTYVLNNCPLGEGYEISIAKMGYVTVIETGVSVSAGVPTVIPETILISSSCAITGSVVLEGSPGNSGVTVSATLVGDQGRVVTTTTLEDGTYYIGGLDVGQYSIQIQMNGYVTDRSKLVHTTYGETTVIDPVVLKSVKATVKGSVTLIGTNVHTGISVMLKTPDNQLQYDATTAQDGAFVVTGVQPGIYSLYVSKAGYESKAV
ncbi:MAG TPA: carboxypeptidase regulatory-like domain-containing protein, partial [Sphaerochaeta sp.]|nr:carboxypeptidase regulatory-like domain-containing protein [Sphaerochaeta sp.]